jgi:hypothetical protein
MPGPLLEIGFYLSPRPDGDPVRPVLDAVEAVGGAPAGRVAFSRGPSIRSAAFSSIWDDTPHEVNMSAGQLREALRDPDLRIIEIDVEGLSGLQRQSIARVGVRAGAVPAEQHPVAVVGEAPWTERRGRPTWDESAFESGRSVYSLFRMLTDRIDPLYAAIGVEQGLPSPLDLAADPRTLAFQDFYLSNELITARRLRELQELGGTPYVEQLARGTYFSCSSLFNPTGVHVEDRYRWRLAETVVPWITTRSRARVSSDGRP